MTYISHHNLESDLNESNSILITGIKRGDSNYCINLPSDDDIYISIIDRENIRVLHKLNNRDVNLRNQDAIDHLLTSILPGKKFILDITFLPINVWGVLLRRLIILHISHCVMYKSSESYENMDAGETIEEFHMSDEIEGIYPLPGFYRLNRPKLGQTKIFIPILGFQGSRVQYILDKEIEADYLIHPLLGVPGIRSDYGRISLFQNRQMINQKGVYKNIAYYSAWSPFEAITEMKKIIEGRSGLYIKIAPLGNKPSSLAAILFAMHCEKLKGHMVNIIFDHPKIPSDFEKRTGKIYIYDTHEYWYQK
ncbi:hypothetical protein [Deinococcus aquaticus]|uniref:Uncharacterized protein n=1 Tax=Deinococcus aquaticus TaxID=328692 RepID=A0ABY7V4F2_9DEIO|nr:hypothetical protein [Deinococcus aquaticus]WDA59995.1 hypothetical protein M8445_07305 [Deinococcus aquaticus]